MVHRVAASYQDLSDVNSVSSIASVRKPGSLTAWGPGQRKTIYLCFLVLGLCAIVLTIYAQLSWTAYKTQAPGHPPTYGDFFALWSYAKLLGTYPAAELYDSVTLHARQVALGMSDSETCPSARCVCCCCSWSSSANRVLSLNRWPQGCAS